MESTDRSARRAGVVGAGVVGSSVAHALALSGYEVVLVDVDQPTLDRASAHIRNRLRLDRLLRRPPTGTPGDRDVMSRIVTTVDYSALSNVDFVVENVPESRATKAAVYRAIDAVLPPDGVIVANTSCIPITELAAMTERPSRVIGMHFMNPVPLTAAVEVIPGEQTSAETIEAMRDVARTLGKTSIVVRDAPGFVINRVLMLTVNEAIAVVGEGTAPARDVDELFKRCLGHKMGPLETADLIGLDTVMHSLEVLRDSFHDEKYEPCPLLRKMVEDGELGMKSKSGFYRYDTVLGRVQGSDDVR